MTNLPAFAGALLVAASPGWAQPASAQAPEQVSLARELLVAMRAADDFDAMLPNILTALKPAITRGDAEATKDRDEVAPVMATEFSP